MAWSRGCSGRGATGSQGEPWAGSCPAAAGSEEIRNSLSEGLAGSPALPRVRGEGEMISKQSSVAAPHPGGGLGWAGIRGIGFGEGAPPGCPEVKEAVTSDLHGCVQESDTVTLCSCGDKGIPALGLEGKAKFCGAQQLLTKWRVSFVQKAGRGLKCRRGLRCWRTQQPPLAAQPQLIS